MFLDWTDCKDRLDHIVSLLNDKVEPEKKFWDFTRNIVARYRTRENYLQTGWIRRNWELLRGHKGVHIDGAYPYHLIRTKLARDALQRHEYMTDI